MNFKFKDKKNQRKPANSKRKAYLMILASFFVIFLFLCVSPVWTGSTYKYEELKIDEYQILTNNVRVAIAKKEYNPSNKTLRIDYSLQSENDSQILSNLEYTVENKYINQKKDNVKTTVYRASDDYLVVIIENVPEGFGVVSSTITPQYIHPELQDNPNDLDESSFKFYILEKDKMKNTSLKEESKDFYEQEYIALTQKNLNKEIKEIEKEISRKIVANEKLEKQNKVLNGELEYQTEEEKAETQNNINKNISTINNNEKDIDSLRNDIKVKQNKIELLNKKRETVTENAK